MYEKGKDLRFLQTHCSGTFYCAVYTPYTLLMFLVGVEVRRVRRRGAGAGGCRCRRKACFYLSVGFGLRWDETR